MPNKPRPLRDAVKRWADGRRELIIPPALAYGESGGHRLSGKTLIFVIDLIAVK